MPLHVPWILSLRQWISALEAFLVPRASEVDSVSPFVDVNLSPQRNPSLSAAWDHPGLSGEVRKRKEQGPLPICRQALGSSEC